MLETGISIFAGLIDTVVQLTSWAPAGERGKLPPPETEKIVVEILCYFPDLYNITQVREEWIENRSKTIWH